MEGQGSATQKFVLFGSVSAAIGTGLAHSRTLVAICEIMNEWLDR